MNQRNSRMLTVASGIFLAVALGAAPASASTPAPAAEDGPMVIANGLNNPRHLTFGPGGALFVAEAGTGGDGPACVPNGEGEGVICAGMTGSITSISNTNGEWTQFRVITGLPSLAGEGGASATGPSDIAFSGRSYVATIGLGADPAYRLPGQALNHDEEAGQNLPDGYGYLIEGQLTPAKACATAAGADKCKAGDWTMFADIAGFEALNNPVDNPDSNPASVTRVNGNWVVADAGGNTVLAVGQNGKASLIAAFEDTMVEFPPSSGTHVPMQFVATGAEAGPGGSYFVSQLTGFPFPVGGSSIWQVIPARGNAPAQVIQYATGLTNVTDLAVADNGDIYAVQITATGLLGGPVNGSLVRISADGAHEVSTVVGGLAAPYGVALQGDFAYVTTGSVEPGGGQVIQVPLG